MHTRSLVRHAIALATLACLVATPAAYAQTTLDFENLSNPANGDSTQQGISVTQNGFTVTDTSPPIRLGFISIAPNSGIRNYTGSVALFNNTILGVTTLTQNNGNAFTLNSIDLADLFLQPTTAGGANFTGRLSGGGTVTQSFSLAATNALQHFTFAPTFTNLVSVDFQRTTAAVQFDNIRINQPTPVPEPGSVALLAGIFVTGAGFVRKRLARN